MTRAIGTPSSDYSYLGPSCGLTVVPLEFDTSSVVCLPIGVTNSHWLCRECA
jgi:hypothetical protein